MSRLPTAFFCSHHIKLTVNNFDSMLMYSIVNVIFYAASLSIDGWWILLMLAQAIPIFTLVPRFILNLRELYARDLQGRRGSDIDTAFGLSSTPGHGPVASAIMFAEGGQNEGEEQGEEIQMEERDIRSAASGA